MMGFSGTRRGRILGCPHGRKPRRFFVVRERNFPGPQFAAVTFLPWPFC